VRIYCVAITSANLAERYFRYREADASFGPKAVRRFSYAVLFKNIEAHFKAPTERSRSWPRGGKGSRRSHALGGLRDHAGAGKAWLTGDRQSARLMNFP
jgi:hypothetical protein